MSEEDVKIKFLVPLLKSLGYKEDAMDFDVAVDVHEGRKKKTIFADAVVYTSKTKKSPAPCMRDKIRNGSAQPSDAGAGNLIRAPTSSNRAIDPDY